jgi:hypothetical protein
MRGVNSKYVEINNKKPNIRTLIWDVQINHPRITIKRVIIMDNFENSRVDTIISEAINKKRGAYHNFCLFLMRIDRGIIER